MNETRLSCDCGKVHLAVQGAPIMVAECYCNSCREAARRMARLPKAPEVVGPHDSTHFVMYRKDRVSIRQGQELLRNFRLGTEAHTRRVIASCCNTPVLLEFKGGHWGSLYGNLWHGQVLPKAHLRTMTSDLPKGTVLDNSIPSGAWQTAKFYGALLGAWVAMGFKAPAIALDTPEISVPAAK